MGVPLPLAGQVRVSAIGSPKETTLALLASLIGCREESDPGVLALGVLPPELELVQRLGGPELLSDFAVPELIEEALLTVLD